MKEPQELRTRIEVHWRDARSPGLLTEGSVDLIVTSPPYPMIEMWDSVFGALCPEALDLLAAARGMEAFERMHLELDRVWEGCALALKEGGFACINIGDATRTLGGDFCLFPNHVRIVQTFLRLGLTPLPDILWRKPTNSPTKFLGSGMLPAGAFVTYEHEYVLIFRKGSRRLFSTPGDKARRRESAFFWEERNAWFSDVWMDLRGARQEGRPPCRPERNGLANTRGPAVPRERSAAFPFELPYRLIHMLSLRGDVVLDPFAGTGTTLAAAAAAGRSAIGIEIDPTLEGAVRATLDAVLPVARQRLQERLLAHAAFVAGREAAEKPIRHRSSAYGLPVITRQEMDILLTLPSQIVKAGRGAFEVLHATLSPAELEAWIGPSAAAAHAAGPATPPPAKLRVGEPSAGAPAPGPMPEPGPAREPRQLDLFSEPT